MKGRGNERKEKKRKGMYVANGEKYTLRGTRTHTFCYPGRCPNPVRIEETSHYSRVVSYLALYRIFDFKTVNFVFNLIVLF